MFFILISPYITGSGLKGNTKLRYQEENRRAGYIRQNFWMFLLQATCFADLVVLTRQAEYLYFYGFVQVFLLIVVSFPVLIYPKCNRLLLNNMAMLLGIGFVVISRLTGAQIADGTFSKAWRQYIIVLISLCLCLAIPYLIKQIEGWEKLTWIYGAAGLCLLSIVLILGQTTYGSKLSYTIAGVTFQPSEVVKILFVFFLAGALHERHDLPRLLLTTALAGAHILVLAASRDLGSALILFVVFVAIVFVATKNYLYLLLGLLGGAGASVVAYQLFSHVRVRVLAWRDPWSYIDNQGYQITQSLFAIGSGSWFGMGLAQGSPSDIPFVEEDSIFSAICEEFGTIFALCLILVILSCFIMMMEIAMKKKQEFFRLVSFGIGILYIFQIFLTIGGGIKFIPLTGVTLPFISYGGSSLLISMVMFFILQGIQIRSGTGGRKQRKGGVVYEEGPKSEKPRDKGSLAGRKKAKAEEIAPKK